MLRTVPLLLISAGLAFGAPRPKSDEPPAYYPTTVGDRWVHAHVGKDSSDSVEVEVVAVERKDGKTLVTIARVDGVNVLSKATMELSSRGVYRVANDDKPLEKPICVLKLPAKAGDTWESPSPTSDGTARPPMVNKIVGEELVETPAGKFKAIRVDTEIPSMKLSYSAWYAQDVGLVKREFGSIKLVLKSFTSGKK